MIEKLTDDQLTKVSEYRDRYFQAATSTEPADRERAEEAAKRLADICGVKISDILWAKSPSDVPSLSDSLSDSLRDSLSDSISDSLRDSLSDSISDSLSDSLWNSLWDSLWDSLSDSLRDSLRDSLSDSISDSLWNSLWDSLSDSLWDSLWETGWLSFLSYCVDILEINIDDQAQELLRLYNEIATSCFAVWIIPGAIILCDRPKSVEIVNKRLVGIKWGSK